ncbi:[protein-PII] uridylyltransferase [Paludibacterium paludis]|uniref:Bifunctional uridylyltransferase/uridylyl-removing enzyme n=1 Tax=Paludibacterium paludis TaxID=1225769 RepID=A0A918P4P1_9NEIS|nr:[protein-PII] uridylyltransferase [Paludibacterium paludis]GGY19205.1 bifunctional uridylyltransferase/uridylyl-removing enzyme [Paludibacterium paludis]
MDAADALTRNWRATLTAARQRIADEYRADPQPERYLKRHSQTVDQLIESMWSVLGLGQQAALVAVGGFGRGQLFPSSDIDLLVLLPTPTPAGLEDTVSHFISLMWDVGLEVGHSVRTVEQCLSEAGGDITIETNLLESRLVAGNMPLYRMLETRLEQHRDPLAFFEGKTLEQQQRHLRHFGATNNLEPNIKESPGGLRDLQTILWIGKAIGLGGNWDALARRGILTLAETRLIKHSEKQLMRLRIDLHLLARRREDRLIFDLQQQMGKTLDLADTPAKRASEQVMQLFYRAAKTVSQLNGILLPTLQARIYSQVPRVVDNLNDRFYSVNGMLGIRQNDLFEKQPGAILEAFLMLQRHPELTGFAPRMLRALWHARARINERFRRDPANRATFLEILRSPGLTRALRRMNLYGVLGKYLPNFGRIVGQMQHDLFHVYTVDEHILMVVRNLRRFAISAFNHEYPFLSRLINDFDRPEVLYVAGLFHDIAKGRGGDHSELGRADAREFCENHGLSKEDTDLVEWLVSRHLTMSSVAQKQDIYDPETVARFAADVATPRRLAALYLLTVADIRGTSPKVWNAWKAKLLEDLYHSTLRHLANGGKVDRNSELEERQHQARAMLRLHAIPEGAQDNLWSRLDTVYFLRHEAREIAWHARVLNHLVDTPVPVVRARLSDDREGLQVLVYTPDQPELFVRICAFFGRTNYSIADAKIYTTRHGYALDTFHVFIPEHDKGGNYRDMINFIEFELASALAAPQADLSAGSGRISRHLKHFPITPQVLIRPDDRSDFHVVSLVAGDRPGLLARVASVLTEHGLNVHSAKIMTLGGRVEDSFLVTGPGLGDAKQVIQLEAALIKALRI